MKAQICLLDIILQCSVPSLVWMVTLGCIYISCHLVLFTCGYREFKLFFNPMDAIPDSMTFCRQCRFRSDSIECAI